MLKESSKLTVEGHVTKLYDRLNEFLRKPIWKDETTQDPVTDKAKKLLTLVQCTKSAKGFMFGLISMEHVISINMPTDQEIAAFLSREIKSEYHEEALDIFFYFENILKHIKQ